MPWQVRSGNLDLILDGDLQDDTLKAELLAARTLLGALGEDGKLSYLFDDAGRFVVLAEWKAGSPLAAYKVFHSKDASDFTLLDPDQFYTMCSKLHALGIVGKIGNPVLKTLAQDFGKIGGLDLADNLKKQASLELAAEKLGMKFESVLPNGLEDCKDALKSLGKLVLSCKRTERPLLAKSLEILKESKPTPIKPAQGPAGEDNPSEPVAPEASEQEQFAVDDEITLSMKLDKENKWNGHKAKVLKVLSNTLKLQILTGPEIDQVVIKQKANCLKVAAVAPPAGTKRPGTPEVDAESPASKARRMFGDLRAAKDF